MLDVFVQAWLILYYPRFFFVFLYSSFALINRRGCNPVHSLMNPFRHRLVSISVSGGWLVTLLIVLSYAAIFTSTIVIHEVPRPLPKDSPLDLQQAWIDLQKVRHFSPCSQLRTLSETRSTPPRSQFTRTLTTRTVTTTFGITCFRV